MALAGKFLILFPLMIFICYFPLYDFYPWILSYIFHFTFQITNLYLNGGCYPFKDMYLLFF